jgi:nitroreductase
LADCSTAGGAAAGSWPTRFRARPSSRFSTSPASRLRGATLSRGTCTSPRGTARNGSGPLSTHAASAELTPDFPFPARYSGVHLERRRECGFQLYDSVGISKGDRAASARQAAQNFELFGAPHAAIVTTEAELGVYGAIDCAVYVQTFLLAAQSLGLGAIPQAALAAYAPFIRDFFGLPHNRLIVCGVSFGWPDHDHPANGFRTRRAPTDETVTWVG